MKSQEDPEIVRGISVIAKSGKRNCSVHISFRKVVVPFAISKCKLPHFA